MKFAETLGAHITPTWRKQYIEYEVSLTYNIYTMARQLPCKFKISLVAKLLNLKNLGHETFV